MWIAILVIIVVLLVAYIVLDKYGIIDSIIGNTITSKVEKKKKVEGEIEVLKKEQKIKSEEVIQEYNEKKTDLTDSIDSQINSYKAQINSLMESKKTKIALIEQEKKVQIDKVINDFDRKIVSKQNHVKRLNRLIDAEYNNMEDVIVPDQPNAPREIERPQMGFKMEPEKKETPKKSKK